jgi:heptosyltransferase I
MPRILLVKTSSLGDVVHNLPVVGDLQRHLPDAMIDWVVESSFAAIARLHAGVRKVIPVALRRWRRTPWQSRHEICDGLNQLRAVEYDAIIDTQGLFKSAIVARAARGVCHGLDWPSSREPLRLLYDHTYRVPWGQHAVVRNRSLAAQAMGYALHAPADYGISAPPRSLPWLPAAPYAVLLHATSANAKLWPEPYWLGIYKYMILNNILCVLPWGSDTERERSERLVAAMPQAIVPPRLPLEDVAALLSHARVVVGVDTGLTHLAVALGVATVGLYCATDPAATGLYASAAGARAVHLGGIGAPPAARDVIAVIERLTAA